jgi:hypothetical protein
MAYEVECKWRPHRDMCLSLDILMLHRGGYLEGGIRSGVLELRPGREPAVPVLMPFVADMRDLCGMVAIWKPDVQYIDVVRVETHCGRRLLFRCKCGRPWSSPRCAGLTRRLVMPHLPGGVFACRSCWHVDYRPSDRSPKPCGRPPQKRK